SNRNSKNSVQDAFKARLAGSRFRILNEELYTNTSTNSYDKFKANPELFEQYHDGFRHQVESWPENPIHSTHLQLAYTSILLTPLDFGCGEAELAKDLSNIKRTQPKQNIHSFDLVSPNKFVTACDMSNVPLEDKSVDVCVFCLSLMGTNLADFIREAHRVLKNDGRVQIAEVRSRIEYIEKTEGTLDEFIGVLGKLGFECVRTDRTNTMFLLLELKKNGKNPSKKLEFSAKPCIYKRR
ncbi:Methyltransf_8-domain-containing protein, partial [Fragilariopsis cylindrus CCMP1102]